MNSSEPDSLNEKIEGVTEILSIKPRDDWKGSEGGREEGWENKVVLGGGHLGGRLVRCIKNQELLQKGLRNPIFFFFFFLTQDNIRKQKIFDSLAPVCSSREKRR